MSLKKMVECRLVNHKCCIK